MSEIVYRRLPAEEFDRLRSVYEEMGEPFPVPERTVFYVAERGDEIVGLIAGQQVVCVSPLWVRPALRGAALGVARRLAEEGYRQLPEGVQKVFITSNAHVEPLAFGLGFVPKLGQLWMEVPAGR